LGDASGALAGRFLILRLAASWYGKEDTGLTARLLAERPGILKWAIDGLNRLTKRGRFLQPASASQCVQDLEDLSSPVSAFVKDRCAIGPEHEIEISLLYTAWRDWCTETGRDNPGDRQLFGRNLRAAFPGVDDYQPRDAAGHRFRAYRGVGLI